jgi:WD40 repeat protein
MKLRHVILLLAVFAPLRAEEPDYFPAVAKLIEDRCLDCHAADDPDGKFVMERHEDIMKGGESGPVVKPGKGAESLIVRYLRGEVEKDGKKRFMPPGKRDKLTTDEVETFVKWIDAGAKPPQRAMGKKVVEVPKVTPKVAPRAGVSALAFSPQAKLVAVGRHGLVELLDPASRVVVRKLEGHRGAVNAVVWSGDGTQLFAASGENAIAGEVKQWNVAEGRLVRTIAGHRDMLYALALSPDGKTLATGSYDQKIKLWNVGDGTERLTLSGHNGAVYGLAFRPDGRILASASADRTVKLWDVANGERRDTLSQPAKEQFAVAWSADGTRLAAAGADNRIRVWQVSTEARETTNPLLHARFAHEQPILRLVWSADGTTMLSSAQDGTVKLWDAAEVTERLLLEKQPDWPTALAFTGAVVVTGCADGTLAFYDAKTGKLLLPPKAGSCIGRNGRVARWPARPATAAPGAHRQPCPPKTNRIGTSSDRRARRAGGVSGGPRETTVGSPVPPGRRRIFCQAVTTEKKEPAPSADPAISGISPRGIERGRMIEVQLSGKNLPAFVSAKCADNRVRVFTGTATATAVPLAVATPASLPRGDYEIVASGADGKILGRTTLRVEDIAVFDLAGEVTNHPLTALPSNVWGTLAKAGESDRYEFKAAPGQTLIFDCRAKGIGSKADVILTLTDAAGSVMATNKNYDGSGDPFIAWKFTAAGRHAIVVADAQMDGGPGYFYSLTVGELPFVVGAFPLSVAQGAETRVELVGYNLPAEPAARSVNVKAGAGGTVPLKIDAEKFRSRAPAALSVSEIPGVLVTSDNHTPATAQPLGVPFSANGRFLTAGAADYFRFEARKGVAYAIETEAARRGSPADTRIAVLWPDGRPVERLLLQAVRDSAITFRPTDSRANEIRVENWREMELNELMWFQGEVAKIFRMPEGPDSGVQFYSEDGKRLAYFDTTPTAHALDEACYIVEPRAPGSRLTANGLPVFTLHYANDDDGRRELGSDSRLLFTAPGDGAFLVRVQDSRGYAGERFAYRLAVREAKPDFTARIADFDGVVNAGGGAAFTVIAGRKDGFDGDITCEITGLPAGWHVTSPLVIQAGHLRARGSITALAGAAAWKSPKLSASAQIDGRRVVRDLTGLESAKVEGDAPVIVSLQPAGIEHAAPAFNPGEPSKPREITISPGEIIPAWIVLKRGSAKGALQFDVENLPHGVVVDNLGLNGITLLEGQDAGEIFLKASPWVPEGDRPAIAVCRDAGKQASLPILLHVKRRE